MKLYHLIEVKHKPATNTKGARIKLISHEFGDSVTIARDYSVNDAAQVFVLLEYHGVDIVGVVQLKKTIGILIDDFRKLKQIIK